MVPVPHPGDSIKHRCREVRVGNVESPVLVSHPGRQHVGKLLATLNNAGLLQRFFTVAANYPSLIDPNKKLALPEVSRNQVDQFPWLAFCQYILGAELYRDVYRRFDSAVSRRLDRSEHRVLIGYENANLCSFEREKALGGTTVLDLASVHHSKNIELWEQFPGFRNAFPDRQYFDQMNAYKAEALEMTDYCVCLSGYAKETLSNSSLSKEPVFVLPLPVDRSVFFPL